MSIPFLLSLHRFLGQRGGALTAALIWAASLAFIQSAHSLLGCQVELEFFPPVLLLPSYHFVLGLNIGPHCV